MICIPIEQAIAAFNNNIVPLENCTVYKLLLFVFFCFCYTSFETFMLKKIGMSERSIGAKKAKVADYVSINKWKNRQKFEQKCAKTYGPL